LLDNPDDVIVIQATSEDSDITTGELSDALNTIQDIEDVLFTTRKEPSSDDSEGQFAELSGLPMKKYSTLLSEMNEE
jgi:hypothetical protein